MLLVQQQQYLLLLLLTRLLLLQLHREATFEDDHAEYVSRALLEAAA